MSFLGIEEEAALVFGDEFLLGFVLDIHFKRLSIKLISGIRVVYGNIDHVHSNVNYLISCM